MKIHFLYPITFSENCALYETTWINAVEPDRSQVT